MIVLIILMVLAFIGLIVFTIKNKAATAGIYGVAFGLFLADVIYCKKIKPIDVYRGNTTLEITYKDGVAVDSVVVWKDNIKEEQ